ncbi:MAG TPA: hypothetical protein P5016_06575 [Verrucomicrobiales bacterium]|nr:hypothetical protein [Verrucomicrobiales bacterium]
MKNQLKGILGAALAVAAIPAFGGEPACKAPVCEAPVSPLSGSVSFGYETTYIFRGQEYGDNAPWAGLDVNYAVNDKFNVNAGVWYINPTSGLPGFDELDLYAFVSTAVGTGTLSVGGTYFVYPEPGGDAAELGLKFSQPIGDIVDLGFQYFYEFTDDGHYLELNAGKSFDITDKIALGVLAGISYGDSYYGVSGFNHTFARATVSYALFDNTTLSAYVGGNFAMDDLEAICQDSLIHGGASICVTFP